MKRSKKKKAFLGLQAISWVLCAAGFIFNSYQTLTAYFDHQTIQTMVEKPLDEAMPIPDVVVCSKNRFKNGTKQMLTIQEFQDNTYNPLSFYALYPTPTNGTVDIRSFTTTDLLTYRYGWCNHHHIGANGAKVFMLLLNLSSNLEVFLLHPDDIPTFHVGISVSDESLYPARVSFGSETSFVTVSFHLTYYHDETREMNCTRDTNYNRKGRIAFW